MNVGFSPKSKKMSDIAIASDLVRLVAGRPSWGDRKKAQLERAYRALAGLNAKWTRRRVRALWDGEAARVDHREIVELMQAASDQQRLQEARREHQRYIEKTERLAAFLAHQDAPFHRPQIEALRGVLGGMDRTGIEDD